MKNTPSDGSIKRLFEGTCYETIPADNHLIDMPIGEMENYIECIDVDYKSA